MSNYEIWIGYYHLGQGYEPSTAPQLMTTIESVSFDVACLTYELQRKLAYIMDAINTGQPIYSQNKEWDYNATTNSNSWTGPYYATKEEAQASFHRH
jgi:hypothetical protein